MNGMDVVGDDRILLCEPNRVVEYDLKTGKPGWNYTMNMATSVQRLPNGNTLIASVSHNKAVEVTPDGEVVWEYQAKDGLSVARAYRR
jgi:outer membrane protein assembly factor BamB